VKFSKMEDEKTRRKNKSSNGRKEDFIILFLSTFFLKVGFRKI
jgi:hypothetical protein